jgi:predicted ATPase/signal transduction histidine kinase/DNA-binding response OmpR family regulator
MQEFIGYETLNLLNESKHCQIWRAIRIDDKQKVIIKALKETAMQPKEIKKLHHEFVIAKKIDSSHVVNYLELLSYPHCLAIVQADDNARDLESCIPKEGFAIKQFLDIAQQLVKGLQDIHKKAIIFKDLKPKNIIFNQTGNIKLIDFGNASELKEENQRVLNPHKLEGTLAYISPEQTGRMNRTVDYRTDFYSLGITFYQLLCGQLPFHSKDSMELIHCHIAKNPPPLNKLKPTIPLALSAITDKLLMKNAEDRYQSTQGLLADLVNCATQFSTHIIILPFPLATQDFAEVLQISQKLYGRENEIATLLTTFERISHGKPEILLVTGYSGVGKSSLINEIQKPVTIKKGYFLMGKFEQLNKNIAYSAIAQAFQGLIRQLLGEGEQSLQRWQERLLTTLGSNGQLIIDIIPDLESIIGKQPALPSLGPVENKNRFNLIFQNFINVFAQKEHPLVLFLDDLQWADLASLELIKLFMTSPDTSYLLLISAYRDNEVNDLHPAIMTLEDIRKTSVSIASIILFSLDAHALQTWLADSLHCSAEQISGLADLVYQKTQGNPFFTKMFLQSLYDAKLLQLSNHSWQWNVKKIRQRQATANVVEFMMSRIDQLIPSTKTVLALASCLGHSFSLDLLAIVIQKNLKELEADLQVIFNASLAYEIDGTFYFAHDKVQEAANLLLSALEKKLHHLHIGRLLLQHYPLAEQPEMVFEIIEHLNQAKELITDNQECFKLAELNLLASQKANQLIAYDAGLTYCQAGLALVDKVQIWSEHYAFAFALHKEQAELEYLTGHFKAAEDLIYFIINKAQSNLNKIEAYNLLMVQKTLLTHNQAAIELGEQALALFDIYLLDIDLQEALAIETTAIQHYMKNRTISTLVNAPEMVDNEKRAIVSLLARMIIPAYLTDPLLYKVVVAKAINLSLQYGNMTESSMCYIFYAAILCNQTDTAKLGCEFGLLAIKLTEKYNSIGQKCKVLHIFSVMVNPWLQSLHKSELLSDEAYKAGLASGEILHAGYSRYYLATSLFLRGELLDNTRIELNKCLEFTIKVKNQLAIDVIKCVQDAVLIISGQKLLEAQPDYAIEMAQRKNVYALSYEKIFKAYTLNLLGHFEQALQCSVEAEKLLPYMAAHFILAVHNFYYSLNILALYSDFSIEEQQHYKIQLATNQKAMTEWIELCPENFQHKYLLVAAEIARIEEQHWQAGELYEKAIKAAKQSGYIQDEAKANELAAQFWWQHNNEKVATVYLQDAYSLYQRWGAKTKLVLLKKEYPKLLKEVIDATPANDFVYTTSNVNLLMLDMENIIKASQVISSEIKLEKLLFNMMKIIIETAGAQQGVLLLNKHDTLSVVAEYTSEGEIKSLAATSVQSWRGAQMVLDYVKRSRKPIILGNAAEDPDFALDPYINQQQIKSLLCMPIIKQEELKGMLYIENNLATFAFTQNRVNVLTILATQMAISLENAQFFEAQLIATKQLAEESARVIAIEQYKTELENFIDMICHEIRNPLSGIYGNIDFINDYCTKLDSLVQQTISPASLQEEIIQQIQLIQEANNAIKQCAQHQKTITDDALNLSKLEAKKLQLSESAFYPTKIILEAINMFEAKIVQKKITLALQLPSNTDLVQGDVTRFMQILTNLISNAIKFTTEDGQIKVSLVIEIINETHCKLHVQVQDNGIGISLEEQSHLFERFTQANSRTSHEYGGSGLGLAICKRLVELMGGTITIQSQKGRGSTFSFTISCKYLNKQQQDNFTLATKSLTENLVTPHFIKTILIVEDNIINQKVLSKILQPLGYAYHTVNNGLQAVTLCQTQHFDVIFMDIQMPVLNGLDATRQIREEEQTKVKQPAAIIGISGNSRDEHIKQAMSAGMNDYITKPFKKEEIFAVINNLEKSLSSDYESKKILPTDKTDFTLPSFTGLNISEQKNPVNYPGSLFTLKRKKLHEKEKLQPQFNSKAEKELKTQIDEGVKNVMTLLEQYRSLSIVDHDYIEVIKQDLATIYQSHANPLLCLDSHFNVLNESIKNQIALKRQ